MVRVGSICLPSASSWLGFGFLLQGALDFPPPSNVVILPLRGRCAPPPIRRDVLFLDGAPLDSCEPINLTPLGYRRLHPFLSRRLIDGNLEYRCGPTCFPDALNFPLPIHSFPSETLPLLTQRVSPPPAEVEPIFIDPNRRFLGLFPRSLRPFPFYLGNLRPFIHFSPESTFPVICLFF